MSKYITPEFELTSFHCPLCSVFAEQKWSKHAYGKYTIPTSPVSWSEYLLPRITTAKCSHCADVSIWKNSRMIFPMTGNVEQANADLPKDVLKDYNEAKDIVNISPRGAAALLRLAVQKLCVHFGEKGKVINDDIKNF